jgi:hypothetical protein
VLDSPSLDDLAVYASNMATTALADRSASGGPRVAFTSGVWCDAVVGRYKAEATTVDFKNKVSIYHY